MCNEAYSVYYVTIDGINNIYTVIATNMIPIIYVTERYRLTVYLIVAGCWPRPPTIYRNPFP